MGGASWCSSASFERQVQLGVERGKCHDDLRDDCWLDRWRVDPIEPGTQGSSCRQLNYRASQQGRFECHCCLVPRTSKSIATQLRTHGSNQIVGLFSLVKSLNEIRESSDLSSVRSLCFCRSRGSYGRFGRIEKSLNRSRCGVWTSLVLGVKNE